MNVINTELDGVIIIEPKVFGDSRGFFKETWHKSRYEEAGIKLEFVQDNFSRSSRGVLRGLHFQKTRPQGKLIQCLKGEIYDVIVDVNSQSSSYGKYVGVYLNDENHRQVYIPPGYAHGFCVTSEIVDISYKCTDLYCPEDEGGLIWNDPEVAIDWPVENPKLSEKDKLHPLLKDLEI
jgi:dTDP-4-dehydrorhamnose 3,5-epimerase